MRLFPKLVGLVQPTEATKIGTQSPSSSNSFDNRTPASPNPWDDGFPRGTLIENIRKKEGADLKFPRQTYGKPKAGT